MIKNYWIKDSSRKEIITKTQIPNKGNLNVYANYYNLMDKKGLGLKLNIDTDIECEKFFRKNNFEYIVLVHNNQKELFILPSENIVEYTNRIALKIDDCKSEKEVLNLLVKEMN